MVVSPRKPVLAPRRGMGCDAMDLSANIAEIRISEARWGHGFFRRTGEGNVFGGRDVVGYKPGKAADGNHEQTGSLATALALHPGQRWVQNDRALAPRRGVAYAARLRSRVWTGRGDSLPVQDLFGPAHGRYRARPGGTMHSLNWLQPTGPRSRLGPRNQEFALRGSRKALRFGFPR